MHDSQGLAVTTSSPEVVAAIDHFRTELLSLGPDGAAIVGAADAHPGHALLEAYAAMIGVFGQTPEADGLARRHLDRARPHLGAANDRERALVAAVTAYHEHRAWDALAILEGVLADHPRDLIAAKFLEFGYFLMGQEYNGTRFRDTMDRIEAANAGDGLFHSMHSFGHELAGDYDQAIGSAERGLELAPVNPWADHTLGHAYLKTGRVAEGLAVLTRQAPLWEDRIPIRSHNFWHLALMHLEGRDGPATYRFLDDWILRFEPAMTVQIVDAVSLLWRMELADLSVSDADWARIADLSAPQAARPYHAFLSAHLLFALARAGRGEALAGARRGLEAGVETMGGREAATWREVGFPLIDGVTAFAVGDWCGAADRLGAIVDRVNEVGGSDAQVDLFRQTHLVACLRSGATSAARARLSAMGIGADGPPPTALQAHWLSLAAA